MTFDKPPRYNWELLHKPWYWVFTFWLQKWKNYGHFVTVLPDDPGYDDAVYEVCLLYKRDANWLGWTVEEFSKIWGAPSDSDIDP